MGGSQRSRVHLAHTSLSRTGPGAVMVEEPALLLGGTASLIPDTSSTKTWQLGENTMGIPQTPASEGSGHCRPAWLLGGGDGLFGVTGEEQPGLLGWWSSLGHCL